MIALLNNAGGINGGGSQTYTLAGRLASSANTAVTETLPQEKYGGSSPADLLRLFKHLAA
jgi:hypothetical protein